MTKIGLVDLGATKLNNTTLDIVSAVLEESGYDTDNVDYLHLTSEDQLGEVGRRGYDLVLAFGAGAMEALCETDRKLDKFAGCLNYNKTLGVWVLPTFHPNVIYMPDGKGYSIFDNTYAHIKRGVDLVTGRLEFPPIDGYEIDWEFIGHNGTQGYGGDPKVWSGYFEATNEEIDRQWYILDMLIDDLDLAGTGNTVTVAIDTESFTTDHFKPMTMIQIFNGTKAYAFTWGVIQHQKQLWKRFLEHPRLRFILHNTKHDRKMLKHWLDVDLGKRDTDTMCWAMGLTEKANQTGLKYNSRQYCNAPFYEEGLEEWLDSDKKKWNFGHIRPDVLALYGCYDVFWTWKLEGVLPGLCDREGTRSLVEKILIPAQRTFAEIEYAGWRVDQEYAEELSQEWVPLIEEAIAKVVQYARDAGFPQNPAVVKNQVTREICDCVPLPLRAGLEGVRCTSFGKLLREKHDHNPSCGKCANKRYLRVVDDTLNVHSNPQMQHLCFDVLGMEQTWEGRKTNKYFWEMNQSHEFAQLVLAYRELDYLQRNIVEGFSRFIREDGRIHPDILLFGTKTGRLAVHDPAMQTVPSRSTNGKRVKALFLPDNDETDVVVNVDYSNLELYTAHHLTGDPDLLEALEHDMHLTTAAAMYKKTCEDVTEEERSHAKPVNFGAGYNIKASKLSKDKNLIGITNGQASKAQEFLDAFWGKYKVWSKAKDAWIKEALETCELTTELGRKRRWTLVTADNRWKVENQATNFKGQSLASDLCLTSLIQLQGLLTKNHWGRVLISVHDSIVLSIKKVFIHEAVELIVRTMTTPIFETTTPFKVDVGVGRNYGEACKKENTYDPKKDYVGEGSWV